MITHKDCKPCYGSGYQSGPFGSMYRCTSCGGSGIITGRVVTFMIFTAVIFVVVGMVWVLN